MGNDGLFSSHITIISSAPKQQWQGKSIVSQMRFFLFRFQSVWVRDASFEPKTEVQVYLMSSKLAILQATL